MTILEAKHVCRIEYVAEFFLSLKESYTQMCEILGEEKANEGYERIKNKLIDEYISARAEGYISEKEICWLLSAIKDWDKALAMGIVDDTCAHNDSGIGLQGGCIGREPKEYEQEYKLNCVIIPTNLNELPLLATKASFIAPTTIDLRDYCVETRDQGKLPWCAAFAATGFASNILWRKEDIPVHFEPERIYRYAKTVDGSPNTEGTSLVAVLEGLLNFRMFNPAKSSVKVLRTFEQVKYAVHKFGCCLVGLNVSNEWYDCNKNKSTISGKKNYGLIGGHAVLVCGYNKDGVIIQNSWGVDWGAYGFALITWNEFEREFMYGAVLDNCLYETKMN